MFDPHAPVTLFDVAGAAALMGAMTGTGVITGLISRDLNTAFIASLIGLGVELYLICMFIVGLSVYAGFVGRRQV